jgi:hypothetical protein
MAHASGTCGVAQKMLYLQLRTLPVPTGRGAGGADAASGESSCRRRHSPGGEMANTADSKSAGFTALWVRVPPRA